MKLDGYLQTFKTSRGIDVIEEYISDVDNLDEALVLTDILEQIKENGSKWLASDESTIHTKHWEGKVLEIVYNKHRIFYCYVVDNVVYMLHGCVKVKGKTTPKDSNIVRMRYKSVTGKKL